MGDQEEGESPVEVGFECQHLNRREGALRSVATAPYRGMAEGGVGVAPRQTGIAGQKCTGTLSGAAEPSWALELL